ncbi:MAG TPA: hypothetical protein VFX65_09530 [Candidatus Limnocylindrales bacterium]|nr:hypothetical protein [Candidatus Limnocylindrales bacterium]
MTARPPRLDDRSHVVPRRADGSRGRSGPHLGPIAITPVRVTLVIALVGALAFIAYAVIQVDDSAQIPMVTVGTGVLGIVFAAFAVGGAIRMWRAWQDGLQGRTFAFAVVGGLAGMVAIGCFAGALVLALVWGA